MILNYKTNTINFDRIVAYGCSLTAGMELADSDILDIPNIDEYKKSLGVTKWLDLLHKKLPLNEVLKLENNLAWPKYVADYFNVDYVNRAVYGSNGESSIWYVEQDIASGFLKDTDLILVGQTEPTRYFWLTDHNTPMHGCMGGSDDRWPSPLFHKEFIRFANPHHLMHRWLTDIKYLDMLSKTLGGRILQQFCYDTYKLELYSLIDSEFSFNSFVDWNNSTQVHGFSHPRKDMQKYFASRVIDRLTQTDN